MKEPTKIDFHHRRIGQISDFTELLGMLFPGNRNQRYAAACIFHELKWAHGMVPNLAYLEEKCGVSRRILERARAKLTRLGLIEHISYLNSRYGGRYGWRLSSRFEAALRHLANKCIELRNRTVGSEKKDAVLLEFAGVGRRTLPQS
jgi:hypothetical protein